MMQIDLNLYPFNFPAEKVRTIDGDTLIVDIDMGFGNIAKNRNLRVSGLDTPETRTRDKLEKEAGKAVARWVAAVTPPHFTVLSKKLDKYGRVLGNVIWPVTIYAQDEPPGCMQSDIVRLAAVDNPCVSLSYLLIGAGLARPYDGGKRKTWTRKWLRDIIKTVEKDFEGQGYYPAP